MVNIRTTFESRSKKTGFMGLALLFAFLSGGILSGLIPEDNCWVVWVVYAIDGIFGVMALIFGFLSIKYYVVKIARGGSGVELNIKDQEKEKG